MKQYPSKIASEMEAFRIKDSEKEFFKYFKSRLSGKAIMKVTPFKSFYADMYYEEPCDEEGSNYRNILLKFMDTFEETFSILEEELIEIMQEEEEYFQKSLMTLGENYRLNYIYFMPFVDLSRRKDSFCRSRIIDRSRWQQIKKGEQSLQDYMSKNEEVLSQLLRYQIAKEYHILKKESDERILNKDFKKIVFTLKDQAYQAFPLTGEQMSLVSSVQYGSTLFFGSSGVGKTTVMLARLLKLSKIYPKDKFLYICFNKQLTSEISRSLLLSGLGMPNIEIVSFHSFILNISKQYGLRMNHTSPKSFNQQFDFIFGKVSQICSASAVYKGIFIDEAENFKREHLDFLRSLLYRSKYFFTAALDRGKDMRLSQDLWSGSEDLPFDHRYKLDKNCRMTKALTQFSEGFTLSVREYAGERGLLIPEEYYGSSVSLRSRGKKPSLIQSRGTDEKFADIVRIIGELKEKKGFTYSEIGILFPFNKRKMRSGSTIYFQYLLREALQRAGIPFLVANEDMSGLTYKSGVTLSNIFSVGNLEFPAVILCEPEMIYGQSLSEKYTKAEAQSFLRSMNILYSAMTRAIDSLYIVTLLEKESPLYRLMEGEAIPEKILDSPSEMSDNELR